METEKKKKGLFILSRVLGLKTVTAQIVQAIESFSCVEPEFFFFDVADYQNFRSWSRFNFWKNKFEAAYCLKEKMRQLPKSNYDFVFIHGYEFVIGVKDLIEKTPTALFTDSTDILSHELLGRQSAGAGSSIKTSIKDLITKPLYAPVLKNIDFFLPMSEWCATSLRRDYAIPADRIMISHGGLDVEHWKPLSLARSARKRRLLFVGNDLERKGGRFLLEIYEQYLQSLCELVIVSTDPGIKNLPAVTGVEYIPGVANHELINLFNSCDLFVFPSFKEQSPNVLKEAAAAGLPVVARNVGGVSEIVHDSVNGVLMPYQSSAGEWAHAIAELIGNDELIFEMSKASRTIAVQEFSSDKFRAGLLSVVQKLTSN